MDASSTHVLHSSELGARPVLPRGSVGSLGGRTWRAHLATSGHHATQALAAPQDLLPPGLIDGPACPCNDLLHYGLLSQSGCPAVAQHLAEAPAPKEVLFEKLFTSLAALHGAKVAAATAGAGGACGAQAQPAPPAAEPAGAGSVSQPPVSLALLEKLEQLDLSGGSMSPTGPLSRVESIASSIGLPAALPSQYPTPHSKLAMCPHIVRTAPSPAPPAAAAQQTEEQEPRGAALAALNAQLLGALPPTMRPGAVLHSPQLQMQQHPPGHSLQRPSTPTANPIQLLHQQLLWQQLQQHQLYQAFHTQQAQQAPHAAAAAHHCRPTPAQQAAMYHHTLAPQQVAQQEECLVGVAGQYQPYCNQVITPEINIIAQSLLSKLKMLQQADPPQAVWSKRFLCSIKEVSKVVHRAKFVIVAPDVKPNAAAHINPVKMLVQVLRCAELYGVPVVFALSRRGIGQVFGRDKSMSIVAVMSTDHCQAEHAALLQLAQQGRHAHRLHRGSV